MSANCFMSMVEGWDPTIDDLLSKRAEFIGSMMKCVASLPPGDITSACNERLGFTPGTNSSIEDLVLCLLVFEKSIKYAGDPKSRKTAGWKSQGDFYKAMLHSVVQCTWKLVCQSNLPRHEKLQKKEPQTRIQEPAGRCLMGMDAGEDCWDFLCKDFQSLRQMMEELHKYCVNCREQSKSLFRAPMAPNLDRVKHFLSLRNAKQNPGSKFPEARKRKADATNDDGNLAKKGAKSVPIAQDKNPLEYCEMMIKKMYEQPLHSNYADVPSAKGIEAATTIAALAAELKSIQVKGSQLQMSRPDANKFVNCPLVMSIVLAKFKR